MNENDANAIASVNVRGLEKIPPAQEDVVLVYTTFPSLHEAKDAAQELVDAKLAACVNILPGMVSVYTWQDKTENANEVAMLIKTASTRAPDVLAAIKRLHPYEMPARLVLPVTGGGDDFLSWIVAGSTPPSE